MPILKEGQYSYVLYYGKEMDSALDPDELTAAEKKRIVKRGHSKFKSWKSGEVVTVTINKKLSKNTYHVGAEVAEKDYTNRTGKTIKTGNTYGENAWEKTFKVK